MPRRDRDQTKRDVLREQGTLNPRPETVKHPVFQESDFFDARDLVQVKYEMLRQVEVEKNSISQTAGEFGFSRPSFYQAQTAFQQSGLTGLFPQKRGPRQAHKMTQEVMEFVRETRAAQPALRWEQMAQQVQERFGVTIHPRSIERGLLRGQKKPR